MSDFVVDFSPRTAKHLGIQMYSTLPPVLCELITNSYDADAEEVTITFNDVQKSIIVKDDGNGMSFDELNESFLTIGRNRRESEGKDESEKKSRKVTGKKGLGKLSVFGVSKQIEVVTIKDNKKNGFVLDYHEMLETPNEKKYTPKTLFKNVSVQEKSSTIITMKNVERKSKFDLRGSSNSIAARVNLFSKNDFKIVLKKAGDKDIIIDQKFKKSLYTYEYIWDIPKDSVFNEEKEYAEKNAIVGIIQSSDKPIDEELAGIALFARGKLVNEHSFYGLNTSKNFAFSYLTGEVNVDFIDEDIDIDNVATSRGSLVWEREGLHELQAWLQRVIDASAKEWKKKRQGKTKELIEKELDGTTIDKWLQSLGTHDRKLAKKITDSIIDSSMPPKKSADLVSYIQGAFEFESFKNFAADLKDEELQSGRILDLIREWKAVEAKELYKVWIGRRETINKLEQYINQDTKEVDKSESMHEFLKQFPWILEPRANQFQDEVWFSKKLLEKFPDKDFDEDDRRIDFLCQGFGDSLYVIEIKRSLKTITKKDFRQLEDYVDFVKGLFGTSETSYKSVAGYIIGKKLADSNDARSQMERAKDHRMYLKTYQELLEQAKTYHNEFIEAYEKTNKL